MRSSSTALIFSKKKGYTMMDAGTEGGPMNVLVVGVGNVLMGDDGVGVRVVHEIRRRFHLPEGVEVLDGGTSGLELLSYFSDRELIIIVDAVKSGLPPGTVVKVEGEDVPARFMTKISPHQLGLSDVLAAARISEKLPKKMALFGIEPKRVELRLDLSEEVEMNFEKLIDTVRNELEHSGCQLKLRTGSGQEERNIWDDR
jgi:hydrogenase maturation protease